METTTIRRNVDRFIASTGKSGAEYQQWATEVGRKMHNNKLDALICAKFQIYTVAHLCYQSTELPEMLLESEAVAYLQEHSQNPYEIAKMWLEAKSNELAWIDKESILAEHLRAFPKTDFEQNGDPNHLDSVSRSWFKKDGVNLDVQLEEINDMNLSGDYITMEDAIQFVMKYTPRNYKSPAKLHLENIEARFKAVTTFSIKDYYVQHLIKMCENQPVDNDDLPF